MYSLKEVGTTDKRGTEVTFLPDDTIFEKTRFKEDDVKSRMHETAYLNPKLTIIYEDRREDKEKRPDGKPEHIEFHEPDGIIGFVKDLNKNIDLELGIVDVYVTEKNVLFKKVVIIESKLYTGNIPS